MSTTKPVHRDAFARSPQPTPHCPDCGSVRGARAKRQTMQGTKATYASRVVTRDRLYTAASALDERCSIELHPAIALPTHLTAVQLDDIQRVAAWLREKAEKVNAELEEEHTRKHGEKTSQQLEADFTAGK